MAYVKMVTDSAADIPRALREELDIQVLPFPIAMGDKEYEDGYDFTPEEFYGMLLSAPQIPTHAQLNPYVFEQCFEQAYDNGYTHLIYTSINSKGSATHQNAVQAREEFYEEHPEARENFQITIIDSHNYTMTYGWAVVQGAKMAAVGTDPDKVVAYIQDWLDHVRVLFAPLDLRFAKKSGRVSAASPYMVIKADNAPMADALIRACEEEFGAPADMVYPIGGVIAINAGPNLIGVVYREQ